MSKRLNEEAMQDELSGLAFFKSPASQKGSVSPTPRPVIRKTPKTFKRAAVRTKLDAPDAQKTGDKQEKEAVVPGHHDTTIPRYHDTMIPSMTDAITKAVWEQGKEAATHRFTVDEKQAIADIEYTYSRRGIRTCENEIARIAINWVVEDYKANGENSVLHQILKVLHHKP